MPRWPGGIIRKTPVTPTGPYQNGTAPGVWTMADAAYWTKQGLWPIAGNVAPNGQMVWVGGYSTTGDQVTSFSWVVPADVTSISAVVVGSGTAGYRDDSVADGGYGGVLRYATTIAVTPGETLTIEAGNGVYSATTLTRGGTSSIKRGATTLLFAGTATAAGSSSSTIGGVIGGGDTSAGGTSSTTYAGGGAGASSYTTGTYGGSGQNYDGSFNRTPTGGGAYGGNRSTGLAQGGGGVGLLGLGTSGIGTNAAEAGGSGGYGGSNASVATGFYGGGGGGNDAASGFAGGTAPGAVRIIWGAGRSFPSSAADYLPASSSSFSQIEIRINTPSNAATAFSDAFWFSELQIFDENNVDIMPSLTAVAASSSTSFSSISAGQYTVNQFDAATAAVVGYLKDGTAGTYMETRQTNYGADYPVKVFVKPSSAKRISKIVIKAYGVSTVAHTILNYIQVLGDGVDITKGYAIPVKTYSGSTGTDTVTNTLTFT